MIPLNSNGGYIQPFDPEQLKNLTVGICPRDQKNRSRHLLIIK